MSRATAVRVTVELSASFVRLLNAKVGLTGGIVPDRPIDPGEVLARAVLADARGATANEVALAVPPEWRAELDVVTERREWKDEAGAWHRTGEPDDERARRLLG